MSQAAPRSEIVFPGASVGPITLGASLAWYDGPQVFIAYGVDGRTWLVVCTAEATPAGIESFALIPIDAAMATQLSAEPPLACFNAVSRHVINRKRGCLLLHVDNLWRVVAERRAGHAEALDVAVGEVEFLPGNPVVTASAILTPAPGEAAEAAGTDWLVVERGEIGPRVEVWGVTPEVIARGVWDGWISEAGWYWQRMDRAELHGPFADMAAAIADFRLNGDGPGIPHPADRKAG